MSLRSRAVWDPGTARVGPIVGGDHERTGLGERPQTWWVSRKGAVGQMGSFSQSWFWINLI